MKNLLKSKFANNVQITAAAQKTVGAAFSGLEIFGGEEGL